MRIGIDTGGTFTDFAFFSDGELRVHKELSTPHNPVVAILRGLESIVGLDYRDAEIVHGTTVATNALLERKGGRVALVTTLGFEDVIEIGRQNRQKLYDFNWTPPEPLVPRELRFGVSERTLHDGRLVKGVSSMELESLRRRLGGLGLEGIALSLLHSYANPGNEIAVEEALSSLGIPISASYKVLPEFREYERTSTVVANAYLLPKVQAYIRLLDSGLKGSRLFIMQSNGGVTLPEQAGIKPVALLLSGPAGGVVGGFRVAEAMGYRNVITYDMGGTSTDVALSPGSIRFTTETSIDGLPIRIPMIDVSTIGAGGGSIAYVDAGGVLKVGPVSAGAHPGPACYGFGNVPTVTDANVVLRRIVPEWYLGGRMKIYPDRAFAAIRELAESLRMGVIETAEGIIRVSNSNMERALRVISIEKGYDPRDFVLLSFGGAGGLHACFLAEAIGVKGVIFPIDPGALSAIGMLMADSFRDYSQTCFVTGGEVGAIEKLVAVFERLEKEAAQEFPNQNITFERFLDARYKRQSHEISIPFSRSFLSDFHKAHERQYGYSKPESKVEVVTVRLRAVIEKEKVGLPRLNIPAREVSRMPITLSYNGVEISAFCYRREEFYEGYRFSGPALVLEKTSTLLIPPGFRCQVDEFGNIFARQ